MPPDESRSLPPIPPGSRAETMARLRDPGRVAALTDGVFAIVLTILVLEIAVPANLSERSLREVLDDLWPTLVAWVTSFLIVAVYWTAHRDLFARLRYVSRDLVWINLLFLLPVCLIPFGAALMGEYPDVPLALRIYGVVVILAALMRVAMFGYVVRRPWLLWDREVGGEVRLGYVIAAVPVVLYLAATLVAGVSTTASRVLFLAGPVAYFVVITALRERPGTRAEAEAFD